ncbi:hypothetical protein F8388_006842 [Cannabis sativa]|uniref:Neprosin PEP catalytic domain-containing protein n=1 Tax=Cannabis sativa TaxID=3483 RepID=A0A7J6GVD2_CANSA|nr:hypothetical protein F8388_006842 [Cannabis sativa]
MSQLGGRASYFSNIQYMDNSKLYKDPDKLGILVTKPSCYDFQLGQDKSIGRGTYFFFGGPARDLHELLMFFSVCCIHPGNRGGDDDVSRHFVCDTLLTLFL